MDSGSLLVGDLVQQIMDFEFRFLRRSARPCNPSGSERAFLCVRKARRFDAAGMG